MHEFVTAHLVAIKIDQEMLHAKDGMG